MLAESGSLKLRLSDRRAAYGLACELTKAANCGHIKSLPIAVVRWRYRPEAVIQPFKERTFGRSTRRLSAPRILAATVDAPGGGQCDSYRVRIEPRAPSQVSARISRSQPSRVPEGV